MQGVPMAGNVRAIVEEARREFFFSDDAEHDEQIGDAFTKT